MTVQDIISHLNLTVCSGKEGLQREIKGGYTSDLLSDVMGIKHAPILNFLLNEVFQNQQNFSENVSIATSRPDLLIVL